MFNKPLYKSFRVITLRSKQQQKQKQKNLLNEAFWIFESLKNVLIFKARITPMIHKCVKILI